MNGIEIYLVVHGITTVGTMIGFLIKNEHRITKLEISLADLKNSHDTLTAKGTIKHED